jgi:hypothetical protein
MENKEQITDINSTTHNYLLENYKSKALIFILAVVVYEYIVYRFVQNFAPGSGWQILHFLPIVVIAYIYKSTQEKIRHEFYRQIAGKLNFSYSQAALPTTETGAIFQVGHGKRMEDILTGKLLNLPVKMFNYFYTVGSGKTAQHFEKTIWQINFPTTLPPVLLLNDFQSFGDFLSNNNLKNVSKIELPVSVENKFSLYSEKKFETEALQIFTPDVLEKINNDFTNFSLDFAENNLYIYAKTLISNSESMDKFIEFATYISGKLEKLAPGMQNSVIALKEALKKEVNSVSYKQTAKNNLNFVIIISFFVLLLLIYFFIKTIFS